MERFYGPVGYVFNVETAPGVYSGLTVREENYYGEVKEITRRYEKTEQVNDDLVITNEISIMADAFAYSHFFAIKYVKWMGVYWKVSGVRVSRPRLILSLGGEYNGQVARESSCSTECPREDRCM